GCYGAAGVARKAGPRYVRLSNAVALGSASHPPEADGATFVVNLALTASGNTQRPAGLARRRSAPDQVDRERALPVELDHGRPPCATEVRLRSRDIAVVPGA